MSIKIASIVTTNNPKSSLKPFKISNLSQFIKKRVNVNIQELTQKPNSTGHCLSLQI